MKKVYIEIYEKAARDYGQYSTFSGTYKLDVKGNLYLYFPRLDPVYGNKRLIATAEDYAAAKAKTSAK